MSISGGIITHARAREVGISAVVYGPDGKIKRDLGTIAYWHRNPFMRLWWNVTRLWRSQ